MVSMINTKFRFSEFLAVVAVSVILTIVGGCKKSLDSPKGNSNSNGGSAKKSSAFESDLNLTESQRQIQRTMASEDLLQSFSEQFGILSRSFRDRETDTAEVFEQEVEYLGLGEFDFDGFVADGSGDALAAHGDWPIASSATSVTAKQVWEKLLSKYTFESCQFGTVDTRFVDSNFQTDTKFEGRFRTRDNKLVGVKAHQTIEWTEAANDSWKIKKWIQSDVHLAVAPGALFEDVTAIAIPDADARSKVQSASHADKILASAKTSLTKVKPPHRKFEDFADWESAYQYPAVSSVDIDQDGFDDLFVTDRWQSAQLLRNKGDGTFEDITEQSGLTVDEMVCGAYFADFDNDGDSDLFVCGTLEPSKYFENVDGVFKLDEELQKEYKDMMLVVSGSVVDVNGDGLLDMYLNTYGFGTAWRGDPNKAWSDTIIRVEDRLKMRMKIEKFHWYVDRGGAPNVLLLNEGGKLKRADIDDTLAQWRNSYQTVWSDYDEDGDPDLYICNDFAPDYFLRNDTERGSSKPKFTEVTEKLVPGGTMGFGMGANWGDYNNDGQLDLYVSNMYSKAGNRIVSKFDDVDERVKVSARGNFLYENLGGKFKQVAGLEKDAQHVSKVGWSFGGQFADFDNDGNLDVYVPSGFYTPPVEVQKPGDW